MPFIDTPKRINIEEFKDEDKEVAERIGNYYNYFVEQVTNTINGQLDFDNLQRSLVTISGLTVGTNNQPIQTTQFGASVGVQGVVVLRAVNTTNVANYVTNAPFISFTSSGDGLYTVDHVTGLVPGNSYNLIIELVF